MKYYKQIKPFNNKYSKNFFNGLIYFELIGNTTKSSIAKMFSKNTGLCLGWVDTSVYLGNEEQKLFKEV